MTCNIYEELGLPDPEDMFTKAQIVRQIDLTMKARGLSVARSARLLHLSVRRLDLILGGRFRQESAEFLLECLRKLGRSIDVRILPLDPDSGSLGEFRLIPPVIVT